MRDWAWPERGRGRFRESAGARGGARQRREGPLDVCPGACPGPSARTRGSCEAERKPVAPTGSGGRSPSYWREAPRIGEAPGVVRRRLPYPRGRGDGHGHRARHHRARPRLGFQTRGSDSSSPRAASPAGRAAPPPPVETTPAPPRSRVSARRRPSRPRPAPGPGRAPGRAGLAGAAARTARRLPAAREDAGGASAAWRSRARRGCRRAGGRRP